MAARTLASGRTIAPHEWLFLFATTGTCYAIPWNDTPPESSVRGSGLEGDLSLALTLTSIGTINNGELSPDGKFIAFALTGSPFVVVYPWNDLTGFGSKVSDPASLPNNKAVSVSWSPDGRYLAVAQFSGTEYLAVYPWSNGAFGTKVAAPATPPPGVAGANVKSVAWHPGGRFIALGTTASPFVNVWDWDGSAFGAKWSDPGTLPAGSGFGVAWSPDGAYVACGHNTTPFISVYPVGNSAFGTKVADPAPLATATMSIVEWTPDGLHLVGASTAAGSSRQYCRWAWSGGFGILEQDGANTLARGRIAMHKAGYFVYGIATTVPVFRSYEASANGSPGIQNSLNALRAVGWSSRNRTLASGRTLAAGRTLAGS